VPLVTVVNWVRDWLNTPASLPPSSVPAPAPVSSFRVGATLLTERDRARLGGVHPDLVRVVERARASYQFIVIEGLRSEERQKQLFAQGATKTMRSRHLTGHAVDLAPMIDHEVRWDWPAFYPLAEAVKAAAKQEGVRIEWGGDWRTFKDGPHWQLPWDGYP
jgi:peptidoglycan L-alanyl-D-glutamate endopeptidase CwlK